MFARSSAKDRRRKWPVLFWAGLFATAALLGYQLQKKGYFKKNNQSADRNVLVFQPEDADRSVLLFSKTDGFRHASIGPGISAITKECIKRGWQVHATEDAAFFNQQALSRVKVVVFLSTTGQIFNADQKAAFEHYMNNGGGYAGIHSASDTEHDWKWYGRLLGTFFRDHTLLPHTPEAELRTENASHPINRGLPLSWRKRDEWYNFQENIRGKKGFEVLLSLDEQSYFSIWRKMNGDHPISWTHQLPRGRVFYTALGHNAQTFTDSLSMRHIIGGIQWAGKLP